MDEMDLLLKNAFSKTGEEWKISDEGREKILNTNIGTKHTHCGKRIMIYQTCVALFIVVAVSITAYASGRAVDVLKEKVAASGKTDREIEKMYDQLMDEGVTDEDIQRWPGLRINEDGLTYGPERYGADLIYVSTDDGKSGYVYRTDLEKYTMPDVSTPEEALEWQAEVERNNPDGVKLTVYKSDGKTEIGTFTLK